MGWNKHESNNLKLNLKKKRKKKKKKKKNEAILVHKAEEFLESIIKITYKDTDNKVASI